MVVVGCWLEAFPFLPLEADFFVRFFFGIGRNVWSTDQRDKQSIVAAVARFADIPHYGGLSGVVRFFFNRPVLVFL
ncbi:hypothetical protein FF011L_06450 [Roseimaritima multifibrata]|uniref:Uncharacterized protein n=1 Tax=Roseimaritima multifibrata TaxID=1930274 RepID=A0A517MAI9_9BACT|nr:hypothetical protein FF011L_06450 [Roseimaritima multifibrata]